MDVYHVLFGLVGVLAGGAIGFLVRHWMGRSGLAAAEARAKLVIDEAQQKAAASLREAEELARGAANREREAADKALSGKRDAVDKAERNLGLREEALNRQVDGMKRQERFLRQTERQVLEKQERALLRRKEAEALLAEQKLALSKISGLSGEEARKLLLDQTESEIVHEEAVMVQRQLKRVKEGVDKEARRMIANTIQRVASDYTSEITTRAVELPDESAKGKIIGREGRNIRHFEKMTGCDVIVDDTPGAVVISCFEGVRREIGKRAMERLIKDGRIHPARIEEVVAATQKDMEKFIRESGEKVCVDYGLQRVHPEIVDCLGRLQFRTSFGQNVLLHSIEVGHIAGLLAAELGLDVQLAKRGGILHDIGKAVDQTREGSHPALGLEIAKRCGERPEVCEAIGGHHDDVDSVQYIYTVLASAADAISASRPGARRDSFEKYIERMTKLEAISTSFPGIEKAYAISAGREIRVIAKPDDISDDQCIVVARDIAKRIEAEVTFPGEIKVTLLRERRIIEYAR